MSRARKIEHISVGVTAELSPTGYQNVYIHRTGEGTEVHSYSTSPWWPVDRKARRLLRFFRLINSFAHKVMTSEVVS